MHLYSLSDYGDMMRDRVRMMAYQQALAQAVKPGDVVVDVGAGAGIMSLHACRLGARRVHAIEPNEVIQVAREVAQANGCADRIVFYQQLSTEVELSELADVVVADPRGALPLYEQSLPTILDARRRLLKPGGVLIPHADTLWVAPVEAPDCYQDFDEAWRAANDGFVFEAARHRALNRYRKSQVSANQLLSTPVQWARLDYQSREKASVSGQAQFAPTRAGVLHGFSLWFDSEFIGGRVLSNAPDQPKLVYGRLFLPIVEPLPIARHERMAVEIHADYVGSDYVWRWTTSILDAQGATRIQYQQSTLRGTILTADQLRKQSDRHVPSLTPEGRLQLRVLGLMQTGQSLGQIAAALAAEFPRRFASPDEALGFAGEVSVRFTD